MKIYGDKIYIRLFMEYDTGELYILQVKNKEFFQKYSPVRDDGFYTYEYQLQVIKEGIKDAQNGKRYSFGIFDKHTGELIGRITLSSIYRGPIQSAMIGYVMDKEHNGKGYMTEAVKLVEKFAFEEIKLHRIEADVMPSNKGSLRVLEKAGFRKEGIARKNVMINGNWEDHQMLAILYDDYMGTPAG